MITNSEVSIGADPVRLQGCPWAIGYYELKTSVRVEEEEHVVAADEAPNSHAELHEWWAQFARRFPFKLYCIVLATEADSLAAQMVENHRDELSMIAGDKCSFIHFRDLKRAMLLEPMRFSDHARAVMKLVQLIEISPGKMPCLLFFENLLEDDMVYVPLDGGSVSELVGHLREVFAFLYSRGEVSLSAVKAYTRSCQVGAARKTLSRNASQFAKDMIGELLRSLSKFP